MAWMLPVAKGENSLPTEEWLRSSLHRKECRYVLPRDGSRNIHAWKQPIRHGHTKKDKCHREVTRDEWLPGAGKRAQMGQDGLWGGKVRQWWWQKEDGTMSLKEGWFISSVSIPGVPPWTSSNTMAFIAEHWKHHLKNHFSPRLGF